MKQVVINADDLGICPETNAAIEIAFRRGILTSASLMPNMPAFDQAVDQMIASNPRLGIGLHLVLTSGPSVAHPGAVPLLVDGEGRFRHGFGGICRLLAGRSRRAALAQVRMELQAQFEKVRSAGVAIDHVDGHQHVHMIPQIWRSVLELAPRYGCTVVRLSDERFFGEPRRPFGQSAMLGVNFAKKVVLTACARENRRQLARLRQSGGLIRSADRFVGVLDSNGMGVEVLKHALSSAPVGVSEILTHPGLMAAHRGRGRQPRFAICSAADRTFLASSNRRLELEALLEPGLRRTIDESGVQLKSFREVSFRAPGE